MLSSSNLEQLIALKKREIEKEKSALGLGACVNLENDKENTNNKPSKVNFSGEIDLSNHNAKQSKEETHRDPEEIPPDLERYIRRYLGLPVMLKAGEYSPNNPLVKAERTSGDVLLGLGEYERRRNTLRKIRQIQYKEYLDEQAKKKQEAKAQAERERCEREEKEREREEREKELLLERDRNSPLRRCSVNVSMPVCTSKVDTGVQVDGFSQPLSVAVQTDNDLFANIQNVSSLTQAERELSPRGATDVRRRSHGDYDRLLTKSNRDKLTSDLRHTYMPSIFDSEAIRLRNMQAEKEAAERRQYYQQELKNQILEQQRIKEERKSREKMLEQAEMRRLEEQLRMLRLAQDREVEKQREMNVTMTQSSLDYNTKRKALQKEIDEEKQKYIRAVSQPLSHKRNTHENLPKPLFYPKVTEKKPYSMNIPDNSIFSSNYDVDSYLRRNLNFNKEKLHNFNEDGYKNDGIVRERTRFGTDKAYIEGKLHNFNEHGYKNEGNKERNRFGIDKAYKEDNREYMNTYDRGDMDSSKMHNEVNKPLKTQNRHEITEDDDVIDVNKNILIEKALVHNENQSEIDSLPIPVLRHSPKTNNTEEFSTMSEAMKKVDDKWKVPAVQKNILKALPTQEGKNINILTQLGSIRRQLQLEQLKLDSMMKKDD